jgi:hypothetical protein
LLWWIGFGGELGSAGAHPLGDLHGDVSHAAAGPKDHQRVARPHLELIVECLQRRDAVGREGHLCRSANSAA